MINTARKVSGYKNLSKINNYCIIYHLQASCGRDFD